MASPAMPVTSQYVAHDAVSSKAMASKIQWRSDEWSLVGTVGLRGEPAPQPKRPAGSGLGVYTHALPRSGQNREDGKSMQRSSLRGQTKSSALEPENAC